MLLALALCAVKGRDAKTTARDTANRQRAAPLQDRICCRCQLAHSVRVMWSKACAKTARSIKLLVNQSLPRGQAICQLFAIALDQLQTAVHAVFAADLTCHASLEFAPCNKGEARKKKNIALETVLKTVNSEEIPLLGYMHSRFCLFETTLHCSMMSYSRAANVFHIP